MQIGAEARKKRDIEVAAVVEELANKIHEHAGSMGYSLLDIEETKAWIMKHIVGGSVDYDERLTTLVRMILATHPHR